MSSGPRWPGSSYVVLKEVLLCVSFSARICKIRMAGVKIGWIPLVIRGQCLAQSRCLSICHAMLHAALGIGALTVLLCSLCAECTASLLT